jgi:hypothetical protein
MLITSKKILIVVSLLSGLPATGMVRNRLDLFPTEVSVEIARYYAASMVPRNAPESSYLAQVAASITGKVIDKGYSKNDALEEIKKYFEIQQLCQTDKAITIQILLEHLVSKFDIKTLQELQSSVDLLQKSDQKGIFQSSSMVSWLTAQKRKIGQEHEVFDWDNIHWTWQSNKAKIEELIGLGINVNVQDSKGMTPLMHACLNGDKDSVELLLKADADVAIRDKKGRPTLAYVPYIQSKKGDEIIAMLLSKGADPKDIPSRGYKLLPIPIRQYQSRYYGCAVHATNY